MRNKEIAAAAKLLGMNTRDTKTLIKMLNVKAPENPPMNLADYIKQENLHTETTINKHGKSITKVFFKNGNIRSWATEHLSSTHTYGN